MACRWRCGRRRTGSAPGHQQLVARRPGRRRGGLGIDVAPRARRRRERLLLGTGVWRDLGGSPRRAARRRVHERLGDPSDSGRSHGRRRDPRLAGRPQDDRRTCRDRRRSDLPRLAGLPRWKSTRAHGFYSSGLVLGTLVLLLVLRLAERRSRRDTALLGLTFGLGAWQTPQIVPIVVPALAWLTLRRRSAWRDAWVAVPLVLVGALPSIVSNVRHDWWSFRLDSGDTPYVLRVRGFLGHDPDDTRHQGSVHVGVAGGRRSLRCAVRGACRDSGGRCLAAEGLEHASPRRSRRCVSVPRGAVTLDLDHPTSLGMS